MDSQDKNGREQSNASGVPEKSLSAAAGTENVSRQQPAPQPETKKQNKSIRQIIGVEPEPSPTKDIKEEAQKKEPQGVLSKSTNWIVRPLRTYKSDLAEAIKRGHTSLVSITASESNRREKKTERTSNLRVQLATKVAAQKEKEEKKEKRKRDYSRQIAIVSVVLFALGLIIILFFSFIYQRQQGTQPIFNIPELVFTDKQREIPVENVARGNTQNKLVEEKENLSVSTGSIEMFYFTRELATERFLIDAPEFLELIEARAPDTLVRSLSNEFTFGVHAIRDNESFLILKLRSYNIAFASMLEWEASMNEDLAPLFGPIVQPAKPLRSPRVSVFRDMVIINKDVRALVDEQGTIALLYSFPDRETLVITTNEQTFAEIFTRLTSSRVQR